MIRHKLHIDKLNIIHFPPLSAAPGGKNETPLKLSVITAAMALMMMA